MEKLEWYAESFQMGINRQGDSSEVRIERIIWRNVREKVNDLFGTLLDEFERGDGQVYIWQQEDRVESYGNTHKDAVGRMNMHYILIVGDVGNLVREIEIPTLNRLTDLIGWKYDKPKFDARGRGGQPHLFTEVTDLHVLFNGEYRHSKKE